MTRNEYIVRRAVNARPTDRDCAEAEAAETIAYHRWTLDQTDITAASSAVADFVRRDAYYAAHPRCPEARVARLARLYCERLARRLACRLACRHGND